MKIAIVCGSLENGKSGVGDYCRILGEQIFAQGHVCAWIALSDPFVEKIYESPSMLRLPQKWTWEQKASRAHEWLAAVAPHWISLQWVLYTFHPRGWVWQAVPHLQRMVDQHALHMMFHETWIGEKKGATFKERTVGWWQKKSVQHAVHQLRPKIIHTSNSVYQNILHDAGIDSRILPMVSTIPVVKNSPHGFFESVTGIEAEKRNQYWVVGFFGTLHPVWPAEPMMKRLRVAAASHGKKLLMLGMGNLHTGRDLWGQLAKAYPEVRWVTYGESGLEEISALMLNLDFGVATTPWQLIGKSTSAMAFLDHGVPLIVNREEPYRFEVTHDDELLIRMDQNFENQLGNAAHKPARIGRLEQVVTQWVNDLA